MLLTQIAALDQLLDDHAAEIGGDLAGYRNHAYRVANICLALSAGDADAREKIAIAVAFHDMGIWTDRTFDYIEPSVRLAEAYLRRIDRAAWSAEIAAMIREHHKVTPYRGNAGVLVEPFRRADWADVSFGVLRAGLPRALFRELYRTWPDAGFHGNLVRLTLRRWAQHPLSPLPMLRW
jgi:hypothetical protein